MMHKISAKQKFTQLLETSGHQLVAKLAKTPTYGQSVIRVTTNGDETVTFLVTPLHRRRSCIGK